MPHGKKQIRQALKYAEGKGCIVNEKPSGHAWGIVIAPNGRRASVWSTPKNADNHAAVIRRFADRNQ